MTAPSNGMKTGCQAISNISQHELVLKHLHHHHTYHNMNWYWNICIIIQSWWTDQRINYNLKYFIVKLANVQHKLFLYNNTVMYVINIFKPYTFVWLITLPTVIPTQVVHSTDICHIKRKYNMHRGTLCKCTHEQMVPLKKLNS